MKKIIHIVLLMIFPVLAMAQASGGQIKRSTKKQVEAKPSVKNKQAPNSNTTNPSNSSNSAQIVVPLYMYIDEKTGKYGYQNEEGVVVVPAKYDTKYSGEYYFAYTEFCFLSGDHPEVGEFHEGMALVSDNRGYGYINSEGKEVIPCQYKMALPFSEDLAAVKDKKTDKWGYINKKGEIVIPFQYRYPRSFTEGYAFVEKEENKWSYIDTKGKNIIPWDDYFTGYNFFVNGLAQIKSGGKYGFINYNGKIVIPCIFDHASYFYGKYAVVEKDKNYGVINREGKYVINPTYSWISSIVDSYVFVKNNNLNGVVDISGKQIIPCEYSSIIKYAGDNIFIVRTADKNGLNQKFGFKHANGQDVTKYEYDEAYGFKLGLASVKKDGKWGFINKEGDVVIPFDYDDSRDFEDDGMAFVMLGGLWASIDTNGNILTPFGDNIQAYKYRAEVKKKKGKSIAK